MPLYEYRCDTCGQRFEQIHPRFSDPPAETCPLCGKGPVQRLLSSPAIQFKGSGWYITDYAKKGQQDAGMKAEQSEKPEKPEKSEKSETSEKSSTADSKSASDTNSSASAESAPASSTPAATGAKE